MERRDGEAEVVLPGRSSQIGDRAPSRAGRAESAPPDVRAPSCQEAPLVADRQQDLDVGDVSVGAGQLAEAMVEVSQVGASPERAEQDVDLLRQRERALCRLRSAMRVERRISNAVAAARTMTTVMTSSATTRNRSDRQGKSRIWRIISLSGTGDKRP